MTKGFLVERQGFDLRLDGASKHLETLDTEVERWKREAYRRLTRKSQLNPGEKEVWVEIRKQPPQELSLLVSDFLHNMRACLDNIAYELAIRGNRGMPLRPEVAQGIGFPILRVPPKPNEIRGYLGPTILNARTIIEGLQPHVRGNGYFTDPLFKLHELNRFDKHRHLHAVGFAHVEAGLGGANLHLVNFETLGALPEGLIGATKMARYTAKPIDPRKKMKMNLVYGTGIVFERSSPVGAKPVLTTLREIQEYVTAKVIPPLRRFLP